MHILLKIWWLQCIYVLVCSTQHNIITQVNATQATAFYLPCVTHAETTKPY